ncbi:hypothetical protein C0J52_27642 [Blattella germanica]|nr:hypothetical protein C0J52_27642 [Blattella germanica]
MASRPCQKTDPSSEDCNKYELGHVVNDEPSHKIYNFAYETAQSRFEQLIVVVDSFGLDSPTID